MDRQELERHLEAFRAGVPKQVWEASRPALEKRLEKGPLRIKAGFDPTAPEMHLGHAVLLWKLKRLQDLGHEIIVILGDFTARIGDPSGRNSARSQVPALKTAENSHLFERSVTAVLGEGCTILRNSKWFEEMAAVELLDLMSSATVSQMLRRRDFRDRMDTEGSVRLHEVVYPLLQGYDSVATYPDVEIGGSDQLLNLMLGADMMAARDMEPQIWLTTELLVGLDGVQKMSKSLGNHVALDDPPEEQFGKVMSISDETMGRWLPLLSRMSKDELAVLWQHGPKAVKEALAEDIVRRIHGGAAAQDAWRRFSSLHPPKGGKVQVPDDVETVEVLRRETGGRLDKVMRAAGMVSSLNEAKQLVWGGAVRRWIGGRSKKVDDPWMTLRKERQILQVGKRKFKEIVLK